MLLVNVYAPCIDKPNDQIEFWNKLTSLILYFDNLDEKLIFCGGHINFLMNIGLDRWGEGYPRHNGDVARAVQNFINTFDLLDIWRVRNPHLRQYTQGENHLIQSRLDSWFVPNSMQDVAKNTGISLAIGTDHSLVFLHLDNVQN